MGSDFGGVGKGGGAVEKIAILWSRLNPKKKRPVEDCGLTVTLRFFIKIANMRKAHYNLDNLHFKISPNENALPEDLPKVDFIVLSAVHEHLLPEERKSLMPMLWERLKPGGVIFLNQTPYN